MAYAPHPLMCTPEYIEYRAKRRAEHKKESEKDSSDVDLIDAVFIASVFGLF